MMSKDQVLAIARPILEVQNRAVDADELTMWEALIGDLPFEVTRQASLALLRGTDSFISITAVRQRSLEMSRALIERQASLHEPPSQLSPEQYVEWRRGWRDAAAAGAEPAEAAEAGLTAIGHRSADALPRTSRVPQVLMPSPPTS